MQRNTLINKTLNSDLVTGKNLCLLSFNLTKSFRAEKDTYRLCFYIQCSFFLPPVSLSPSLSSALRYNQTIHTLTVSLFSLSSNVTVHIKSLMVNHT